MSELLGRYVRIEGFDGVGKTTQLELAKEYSEKKGIGAVFVREPGGTEFGAHIRALLLTNKSVSLGPEVECALFSADRRHLWDTVTEPALAEDRLVISDRGIESTVAYQSAGGGISEATIWEISRLLLPQRYISPDALALLALTEEVRQRRITARFATTSPDKIESRDNGYLGRVQKAYESFSRLDYATTIDAGRDPEDVFKDLKPVLFGKFAK